MLLGGILYSNGEYNNQTKNYEINFKNDVILNQILFLCRSLGLEVNKDKSTLLIKDHPSILSIKDYRKVLLNASSLTYDFSIENVGFDEYYGFCLDGNQRFVLGDFSVTHNSGKSTLISSIIYEKSHIFPVGIAMSASESSNHHYSEQLMPSSFVYDSLNIDQLEEFLKRQEAAKKHLANPWAIVVLDDCMEDPKLFNSPLFGKLFKNGRHSKMLLLVGLQYAMDIKPTIRVCIDGVFILRETNLKTRKVLYENYAGIIGDFQIFCDLLDQLTDDYMALYIHNAGTSNKIEDCVYWYKPKLIPNSFKLGCQEYWDYHSERYNENWDGISSNK